MAFDKLNEYTNGDIKKMIAEGDVTNAILFGNKEARTRAADLINKHLNTGEAQEVVDQPEKYEVEITKVCLIDEDGKLNLEVAKYIQGELDDLIEGYVGAQGTLESYNRICVAYRELEEKLQEKDERIAELEADRLTPDKVQELFDTCDVKNEQEERIKHLEQQIAEHEHCAKMWDDRLFEKDQRIDQLEWEAAELETKNATLSGTVIGLEEAVQKLQSFIEWKETDAQNGVVSEMPQDLKEYLEPEPIDEPDLPPVYGGSHNGELEVVENLPAPLPPPDMGILGMFQNDRLDAASSLTRVDVIFDEKRDASWTVQNLTLEEARELAWELRAATERFTKKLAKKYAKEMENTIDVVAS